MDAKIESARAALREACVNLCDVPQEPEYWREVCTAKARLVALLNAAGRYA
jgi:hypothetical protein